METMALTRGDVSMLLSNMEFGEGLAADWMLFESESPPIVRPWMSTTLMMIKLNSSAAEAPSPNAWKSSAKPGASAETNSGLATFMRMVSVFKRPVLLMSEKVSTECSLGSGWALEDTGDDDVELTSRSSMRRVRFMESVKDGNAMILMTCEFSDDIISFAETRESGPQTNCSRIGLIHRKSRVCVILTEFMGTRTDINCNSCDESGNACEMHSHQFERQYHERRRLVNLHRPQAVVGNDYFTTWLNGGWTPRVKTTFPQPRLNCQIINGGPTLERSLNFVIQNEVAGIHPPRASKIFLQLMWNWNDNESGSDWSSIMRSSESQSDDGRGHDFPPLSHATELANWKEIRIRSQNETSTNTSGSSVGKEIEPEEDHENKKDFKCEQCNVNFRARSDLQRHNRTVHERRRNFKCEHCGKRFLQSGHLAEHLRILHDKSRPFQCGQCQKSFGVKSKLDRHVRSVHEKILLFACEVCDKKFRDRWNCSSHMSAVHGANFVGGVE